MWSSLQGSNSSHGTLSDEGVDVVQGGRIQPSKKTAFAVADHGDHAARAFLRFRSSYESSLLDGQMVIDLRTNYLKTLTAVYAAIEVLHASTPHARMPSGSQPNMPMAVLAPKCAGVLAIPLGRVVASCRLFEVASRNGYDPEV